MIESIKDGAIPVLNIQQVSTSLMSTIRENSPTLHWALERIINEALSLKEDSFNIKKKLLSVP